MYILTTTSSSPGHPTSTLHCSDLPTGPEEMPTKVLSRESENDPISFALKPPLDETPADREVRLRLEKEAKHVSDAIDEELDRQRVAERRGPKPIKILLLGQSESGKSTTLKNFQLMYEPKAFRTERASWRAVIQLNVVRSVHLILDAMTRVQKNTSPTSSRDTLTDFPPLTPELLKLKLRLAPLLQVEEVLIRRLTPVGSGETEATQLVSYTERSKNYLKEVAVNSAAHWKDAFAKLVSSDTESFDSQHAIDFDDPNDPGIVLNACSEDMVKLWNDPLIQQLLEKQNLRMEEVAGFFLDSLERVTSTHYIPTDDDILRARLKTLGVTEHRFKISSGAGISRDWRIFDVGGHRSQRAFWAPYFDDMDAIIFLAPISCFDQVLAEDPKVNRLEDSVKLWTTIVSNPLLKDTNVILFLNKIDILQAKLASGIKLSDHVVSYGDRPNDFENTSTYLRRKFAGIMKQSSPSSRVFYCHLTAVTDTKSTKGIISNVKDMIMRQNLAVTNLIVT
ncbi:guanine nucleotide binding protein, alpha subunit [Crucibulum laeve]|uniref:Guanine nucleotide binding protein, alpha subunit n=1 Tax=Crucibulum laeve TaxID=68775 RepID=A0A5C3M609_9AGAR|nr:guanine nucleotide binding protein, alpha subunit [Crucibulum laeve]